MLLTEKKLTALIVAQTNAANAGPPKWDEYYNARVGIMASLEAPLGQLLNPAIGGFVWAWRAQNKIAFLPIVQSDHFGVNGLEGKFAVRLPLVSALLAADWLPVGRRQVRILDGAA
jgi:hypothetical protein